MYRKIKSLEAKACKLARACKSNYAILPSQIKHILIICNLKIMTGILIKPCRTCLLL